MRTEELARPPLPKWWLCFLPLYWFPQSICWGLIGIYLLPFQVADIVGPKRKVRKTRQVDPEVGPTSIFYSYMYIFIGILHMMRHELAY